MAVFLTMLGERLDKRSEIQLPIHYESVDLISAACKGDDDIAVSEGSFIVSTFAILGHLAERTMKMHGLCRADLPEVTSGG